MKSKTIVFDLDDTLVKEIDFLRSAFSAIAYTVDSNNESLYHQMLDWYFGKENVFEHITSIYPNWSIESLKNIYRKHLPDFNKYQYVKDFLLSLRQKKYKLGLITDGFSITQRNKLKSLGIEDLFDLIIISEEFGSEKPSADNYKVFHQFNTTDYFYVGDNTAKDFLTPNKLGWKTICVLNDGNNIHQQSFNREPIYLPWKKVKTILEIEFEHE